MYKLILADDDAFTLKNLITAVDWEKYNFEIVGSFLNAKAAIKFIQCNKVDAIISDIKMPGISGVEFAKYIYENYPNIVFAMLSGHENFEYARQALHYQVVDYILKPVLLEDIERVLQNFGKIIGERMEKNSKFTEEDIELLEFISSYINRKTEDVSVLKKSLIKKGIKNNVFDIPVIFVDIKINNMKEYLLNYWDYGRERLNTAIGNLMNSENTFAVPVKHYFDKIEYLLFFDCIDIEMCRGLLNEFKEKIVKNAKDVLKIELEIEEKRIAVNIKDIFDNIHDEFVSININIIYKYIDSGNCKEALSAYDSFESKINKNKDDISLFHALLKERLRESSNYNSYSAELKELINYSSDNDSAAAVRNLIEISALENTNIGKYDYVSIAKRYVDTHYSEHITVATMAKYISVSEDYFSKIFKRKTNNNFTSYLNEIRIQKAKELLETTDNPVNLICEKVGYNTQANFYKLFKQYVGCSPQEYRKNR